MSTTTTNLEILSDIIAMELARLELQIEKAGLPTVNHITLLARDPSNPDSFIVMSNEPPGTRSDVVLLVEDGMRIREKQEGRVSVAEPRPRTSKPRNFDAYDDLLAACKAYYLGEKDARECERMMGDAIRKAERTS